MTGSSATARGLMVGPGSPVNSPDSQSRGITPEPGIAGHDGKPVRRNAAIKIVDPLTLRPATAPVPTLPGDLSCIAIVFDHAGRGAATTRAEVSTLAFGAQEAGR